MSAVLYMYMYMYMYMYGAHLRVVVAAVAAACTAGGLFAYMHMYTNGGRKVG